jgi:hypothetical protein
VGSVGIAAGDHGELARRLVDGRKVILAGLPLAACTRQVRQLRDLGAQRCLCRGWRGHG